MARLTCSRHGKRVQVIDIGTNNVVLPLVVHRSSGKRNEVCDTNSVTIDGEFFRPSAVLADDWSEDIELTNA